MVNFGKASEKAKAYDDAHLNSDVDNEATSIHHTLGGSPVQAAPGNHKHDKDYSPVGHTHDLYSAQANCSANTTISSAGVRVDVTGATITVPVGDPTDVFIVNGTWDISQNGTTGVAVCMLNVDGVEQTEQGVASSTVSGSRLNVSKTWRITALPAGNKVFKLTMYINVAGNYSALSPHTGIIVFKVA